MHVGGKAVSAESDFRLAADFYLRGLGELVVDARSVDGEHDWAIRFGLRECPDFVTLLHLLKQKKCFGNFVWVIGRITPSEIVVASRGMGRGE